MQPRHDKLQFLLLRFYLAYSICIGMSSYRFDYARCEHTHSRLARRLALLVNAFTLAVLPWVLWDSLHLRDGLDFNRLMYYANFLNVCVRGTAIGYTVLYRHRREQAVCRVSKRLLELHKTYLSGVPQNPQVEARFNRLLYVKFAALLYLLLAAILCFITSPRQWPWYSYALMFLFVHIQNILHCTVFSYFLIMWYMCRGLCHINVQLQHLRQQLETLSSAQQQQQRQFHSERQLQQHLAQLHRELLHVLRAHWLLVRLVRELNGIYCLQMLAMRVTCIVTNVMMGFYGFIYTFRASVGAALIGCGFFTYFVMTLDFYLVDLMCDMLAASFEDAAQILREFNTLTLKSKRIKIALEQLSLQLSCSKLRVDLCGLFEVDMSLWFQMSASIVSFTIVVVQFHMILSYTPGFQSMANTEESTMAAATT